MQGVEAEVAADMRMEVFGFHTVVAELAGAVGVRGMGRDDHPAVAKAAEVFGGEEGEATEIAEGAGGLPVLFCPDRLGGVFDDDQVVGFCQLHERAHLRHLTEEVDGRNDPGLGGNSGLDF